MTFHQSGRILGHDHELTSPQAESFRKLETDCPFDLPAGKVFKHIPRIVKLDELQPRAPRKRLRMVLNFTEDDPSPPTGKSQPFPLRQIRYLVGFGHGAVVAESHHRHGIGIASAHSQTHLHRIGHGNGRGPQRGPVRTVEGTKSGERRSVTAQSQPCLRVIHRIPTPRCGHWGIGAARRAIAKEATHGRRPGKGSGEGRIGLWTGANNQSGRHVRIGDGEPVHANPKVEVAGQRLCGESSRVGRATDVATAGRNIESASGDPLNHRGPGVVAAQIHRKQFRREKLTLGVGN